MPNSTSKSTTSILALPEQLRCQIWKRVGYKHLVDLRLVCHQFKEEVDHQVGISVVIDSKESPFDFFEDIGIRKAVVDDLSSPNIQKFLLHPELLVELSIHGPISTAFFEYLIESCENIHRLSLVFNKRMLKMRSAFFPQRFSDCLPKCKAIRFVAHTKKEKDLIYICDNVNGLVKDTLEDSRGMTDILFSLIHGCPSPYLEELVLEIIVFAHKNSKTLQQFHLNIKEKEFASKGEESTAENPEDGSQRRDTGAVWKDKSSSSTDLFEVSNFANDRKNSTIMEDAERYVKTMKWVNLPALKKVYLSVHSRALPYLTGLVTKSHHLSTLQVELNGGMIRNCWMDYKPMVAGVCGTLTAIKLVGVSYQARDQKPLDIDFIVFKRCQCLKHLYLSCSQKEVKQLNKAKNISKLPKSLEDFETAWVTVSAWQWFRLLFCFKNLDTVSISYATTSDNNFGRLLSIIQFLIVWKMTKVQFLTVTDIKIKFRNKRSIVKKLERTVPVNIAYHDKEETLLVIDRGQGRKSELSIPSIGSE